MKPRFSKEAHELTHICLIVASLVKVYLIFAFHWLFFVCCTKNSAGCYLAKHMV